MAIVAGNPTPKPHPSAILSEVLNPELAPLPLFAPVGEVGAAAWTKVVENLLTRTVAVGFDNAEVELEPVVPSTSCRISTKIGGTRRLQGLFSQGGVCGLREMRTHWRLMRQGMR